MKNPKKHTVPYRRKREGKTNYKKRRALVASMKPRLVVRVTNTKIITQIIGFDTKGDQILAAYTSDKLKAKDWKGSVKNIPAAYLTGYALGKQAQKAGIKEAVFDLGFATPLKGCRSYACLKGAQDAGLEIPAGDVAPSKERIKGEHIEGFKNDTEQTKRSL